MWHVLCAMGVFMAEDGRWSTALKWEGDTTEQALHFCGFLQWSAMDIVPPGGQLCIDPVKGRAREDVLVGYRNEVALHVEHFFGRNFQCIGLEIFPQESHIACQFQAFRVEDGTFA